jgi:CHAT domain-containing protein/tetratricopeptide (TPR) repeat protein
MIRTPIFAFICYFLCWVKANGQCEQNLIQKQIEEISSTESAVISELEKLRLRYHSCNWIIDSLYAKILHLQGKAYRSNGDLKRAIKLTKEAIEINSKNDVNAYPANCVNGYFNLLLIYKELNLEKEMRASLRQIVHYSSRYPSREVLKIRAYNHVSIFYLEKGDFKLSLDFARLGGDGSVQIHDKEFFIENLYIQSESLIAMEQWDQAKLCLKKAVRIMEGNSTSQTSALIFSQLAYLEKKYLRFESAIKFYTKAKTIIYPFIGISINAKTNAAVFVNAIGDIYAYDLRDYPRALNFYNQAYILSEDPFDRAQIIGNIAMVYSKEKKFNAALIIFQKALSLNSDSVELNLSAKLISVSRSKRIIVALCQDKADTWLAYAKYTNNDKPKLKNALKTYMLADTMIDYMRWEHTGSVSKLFWREKTRGMYERAIETCYLLNDPAKAFYFFEKSRAVMLNDQLNELGANQLLSVKDQEKERKLKQEVSSLQEKLSEKESDEKVAGEIRTRLFRAQEERESFISQLEKSSPQYYAYKYDNRVPDIAELRSKVLHDNQTFVSYFVGDSALYGLAISRKSMSLKKLKLSEYLTNNAQFQKLIGSRDLQNRYFGDYLKVSNQLFEVLLKPFAIAADSRVIISPDGSFLPFEALSSSPVAPDYLVKKYAFSYTYSAGYLAKSKRSDPDNFSTKSFFGLSPVEFAPKLSQATLPGSDLALKIINDHFLFSKTLTGAEASRKAFVKNSPDYKIVQLFTHATADSAGTIPTLYFADSTLRLNELISAKRSSTELLVLSACRTGVGKNQRGEGVFSLARGFAGMGIPSTLTTLWSVENDPIYELTKLFYTELKKELPLDIALQNAQNEWLSTASSGDQLPYAWAGMVLVGNAEPVDMGVSKNIAFMVICISILFAVLLIFLFRRKRFI